MALPTPEQLSEKYPYEHPFYDRAYWRSEVNALNTDRSYWEWVAAEIESAKDDREMAGIHVIATGRYQLGGDVEKLEGLESLGNLCPGCGSTHKQTETTGWVFTGSYTPFCPDCSARIYEIEEIPAQQDAAEAPEASVSGNTLLALAADPIFIGDLVAKHIRETYRNETVLACSADPADGTFDTDLLEEAFGEEGTKDICSDLTGLCVIRFPKRTKAADVGRALVRAHKHFYMTGSVADALEQDYTIYKDGQPQTNLFSDLP